jgi:serine/threonine protein kinase
MPVTSEQYVANLVRSGLISAEGMAAFLGDLPKERQPGDAEGLARELVRAGKLTKYQAAMAYKGRIRGLVLGEYTVVDKIGSGGMGDVFKAQHRRMERIVALKVLSKQATSSQEAVERFHREVRAAAKLMHTNIVTALDAGEQAGIHYLVMEYVEGQSLSRLVKERGQLSLEDAIDYIAQVARGLEYAHSKDVIHRDIKPGNLLVDQNGTVKILDMGLALMSSDPGMQQGERLTSSNQALGTCDYMAPEQAEDTRQVDHRADIYSLGCTLYQLLTGKAPYIRDSLIKVLLAHRESAIPSLCEARPDVPSELDAMFQKMMAKSPEDRHQTMTEVVAHIEAIRRPEEGHGAQAPVAISTDEALTSFFDQVERTDALESRVKTKSTRDETRVSITEPDTTPSLSGRIPPRKSRKKMIVTIAGSVAVALLAMVTVPLLVDGNSETETGKPGVGSEMTKAVGQPHMSCLVLDWPEKERDAAILEIDGTGFETSEWIDAENPNRIRIPLHPGEHNFLIVRPGHEQYAKRFEIKNGEDFSHEPEFRPLTP